jgi:ankyrin repeat protein
LSGAWAQVVQCLLAADASLTVANAFGETPLFVAALGGHKDVCVSLLQAMNRAPTGSSVDWADADGTTPLHAAVQGGHFEVLPLRLKVHD